LRPLPVRDILYEYGKNRQEENNHCVSVVLMIILFWANHLNDYFSLVYFKEMHSGLVGAL